MILNENLLQEDKISILMGIYNCADTLSEAIDSIINQTYTNWQLILCDDCSTDNTYNVAKSYQEKYPEKIVLVRNEVNSRLAFSLNHCLKYADGEFIARMDGDDISLPTRFEKQVDFLERHSEYAIVSSPMIYFDDNGDFRTGVGCGEPDVNNFPKGTPFCHAPCMVRYEAYKAVSGYAVSKDRLRVEDWDLWVRMYEKGFKGYNLSEPLYKMRDDRNAYSRRKFKYRINESRVSASAVKKLKLSKINYIWVLRPIIAGLAPKFIYNLVHKRKVK